MKTYTGSEFVTALATGTIHPSLSIKGMVKIAEDSKGVILFAPGLLCSNWVEIPSDMVEKVEVIRETACNDHTHPYVNITFKDIPTDNQHANVLSSLIESISNMADHVVIQEQSSVNKRSPTSCNDPSFWQCWGMCKGDCSGLMGSAYANCMRMCKRDCYESICI